MERKYDPQGIELKWQDAWAKENAFATKDHLPGK
jgi:leucyl-tRNA synthetase